MKLFKQLFVVGLSFYLILGFILILMVHNIIIYYNGITFGSRKQIKNEVVDTIGYKLDDEVVSKPKFEPVVTPKVLKKDTQIKEKEVELVKDTTTIKPIEDSLKSQTL